jgi:hypothetical protein
MKSEQDSDSAMTKNKNTSRVEVSGFKLERHEAEIEKSKKENINVSLLIENEEFLFQFLICFSELSDMAVIYDKYVEWIEENDFEQFLDSVEEEKLKQAFKTGLVCERMSIMIIYYLHTKGLYNSEIIFIKRIIAHVYKNFKDFSSFLLKNTNWANEGQRLPSRDFGKIGVNLPNLSIEVNNEKILKILEVEIKSQEKEIIESFNKVRQLMDDFTLDETWSYFKKSLTSMVG